MRRQEGFSICEVRVINIKIGNTPYEVEIHFSDKNKETMEATGCLKLLFLGNISKRWDE